MAYKNLKRHTSCDSRKLKQQRVIFIHQVGKKLKVFVSKYWQWCVPTLEYKFVCSHLVKQFDVLSVKITNVSSDLAVHFKMNLKENPLMPAEEGIYKRIDCRIIISRKTLNAVSREELSDIWYLYFVLLLNLKQWEPFIVT